ncbi:MAG: hypothetical protein KGZ58_11445 [Ignavibacteriales bacterium]|nr:hypothetical protein [Ignavibacteriales bacterium]
MISKTEFLNELLGGRLTVNLKAKVTKEDKIDAATLGATPIIERILQGNITDEDFDPNIIRAFHLQYPHKGSFVESVKEHADNQMELQGLLNGVKGKLFELETVNYLNDGHLAEGFSAHLASSPTQEGYDIEILDNKTNNIVEKIQVKATDHIDYIQDTFQENPDIPIITTTEITQQIREGDSLGPIFDIGISDLSLENRLDEIVHIIQSDHIELIFPIPSIGIIALSGISGVLNGEDNNVILNRTIERTTKSVVSYYTGKLFTFLSGIPAAGIIASVGTRLLFGKINFERKKIEFYDNIINESQTRVNEMKWRNEKMRSYLNE